MSVEILIPKQSSALTAAQANMKEHIRSAQGGSNRIIHHSAASSGHHSAASSGHHITHTYRVSTATSARNTQDISGHSTDLQLHQQFDHSHIIYDSSTDTTYLRGRLLGKGGFARCYEILNLKTDKICAGKIISKTRIAKPHQKQKILREVQLQKNLKHKHVVEFVNYFEDDSNVYIILENCSKKSLVHVLKHRKYMTEPEVRYYLRQLVEGVEYIHGNQIIHRDLKLGNMLLNHEMELKLADFGLATKVDFAGEKKMTVCGTPNYIAPEVLQKKGHSFEADIWAVGCITYALLVGRPPFETTTLKETYQRITENKYVLPPSLSTSAKNLIRRCLHAEPASRPTLREIMVDEFITTGYMPRILSSECCTKPPNFPAAARYSSNRPMSYVSEHKTDSLAQLGNALNQMHLDSRSENLLEEKELEDIEIRPPPRPATHVSRNGDSGYAAKETITNLAPSSDGHIDRSRSPQQRDSSVKPRSASVLLETLGRCLDHIPKGAKNNPKPITAELTWVTKWVDYSNKYGFGFQLSTDALGVLFNDTSRIIMASDGRAVQYYDVTGKLYAYMTDCIPDDLERKTTLLQYFARYMDEHLIQGGDLEYSSGSDSVSWSGSLFLKKWFRTAKAIVLYLSDGTLQVNFFDDHTKLILSSYKSDYTVTYIDQERSANTYSLSHIVKEGCTVDIHERMIFARSMLKNLVDIEGADI